MTRRIQAGPEPRAFTLIELLIVAAILAVLAAIAVPNMLEAQTRAKVSRVHSDLRTLATGLESYRVDSGAYPVVGNPALPSPFDLSIPYGSRLAAVSTPVAYLTAIPKDPFYQFRPGFSPDAVEPFYCYAPGNLFHGASPAYSSFNFRGTIYSVASRGPDRKIETAGYCMAHPDASETGLNIRGAYDPTNGVVSVGDVFRLGAGTLSR